MNEWSRSQFVDVPFFVRTFPDSKDNLAKEEIKSFEHIDSLPKYVCSALFLERLQTNVILALLSLNRWQAWIDQVIWPNIENKEAIVKYPNVLLTGVRFRFDGSWSYECFVSCLYVHLSLTECAALLRILFHSQQATPCSEHLQQHFDSLSPSFRRWATTCVCQFYIRLYNPLGI